ncbi:MAG: glycosyl transferase, partial [Xanthobacteraceae bacterium]|nr:glycosyl transferase [Xanthobacteraceae bacterium]
GMIAMLVAEKLDMVVGSRVDQEEAAYRPGHRFGNRVLTGFVKRIFGKNFNDILSGYRVFSRRFVKSFPALSTGFEIETELTVHSLELDMPVAEVETPYYARPEGSASKLNTYRDGIRILWTIGKLFRTERPMQFFSIVSTFFFVLSLLISIPVFRTFFETGLVPRLPTAILATALMLLSFLSLMSGLILDTVTRGRRELKRLTYLSYPAPGNDR